MAFQRTQKNEPGKRMLEVVLLLFVIAYIIISFVTACLLLTIVQNFLLAYVLSLPLVGISSYFVMHFAMPREMVRIDTHLLHEMAKRKLVEFRAIEED